MSQLPKCSIASTLTHLHNYLSNNLSNAIKRINQINRINRMEGMGAKEQTGLRSEWYLQEEKTD